MHTISGRVFPSARISCPGGGDCRIKMTGMLVVSLRGANHGFWSHLGGSGQNSIFLAAKVFFRVESEKIKKLKN